MSDQWLCLIEGQKIGPVTFTRLQQLADARRLRADDYIRPVEEAEWLIAKNVPHLKFPPVVTHDQADAQASRRRDSGPLPVAKALSDEPVAVAAPPRGRAVPAIPKGNAVATAAPPVGKALAAPPRPGDAGVPLIVAEPRTGEATTSHLALRKKKKSGGPLIIGGVAVVGVLALVLVLVLSGAFNTTGDADDADDIAENPPAKKPATAIAPEEDLEAETNPEAASATTDSDTKKPVKAGSDKKALLASVKQFLDITKRYGASKLPVQLEVTGMWLSATEEGKPYVAPPEGDDAKSAARYLVIKLKINNAPGAAPIDYRGWGNEAVLFDDEGKAITSEPPGKSERLAKGRIEPGGSLVDTLVFSLENIDFEKLRLALPRETVGIKDNKSFGLELPRHALGRGLDIKLAGGGDPAVAARVAGDAPQEIIDTSPLPDQTATAPVPKPAHKPKEEEVDDVTRKLEEKIRLEEKFEREKAERERREKEKMEQEQK